MFSSRLRLTLSFFVLALFLSACTSDGLMIPVTRIPATPAAVEPSHSEPTAVVPQGNLSAEQYSPLATPAIGTSVVVTPVAGKASIAGRLIRFRTSQPLANQNLSLPGLLCPPGIAEEDKRKECVYIIDDAFDPSTLSDQEGRFVFKDIAAGEYVLLVGNRVTEYVVLTNEANQPLIWKAEPDQVLDLGDVVVDLP